MKPKTIRGLTSSILMAILLYASCHITSGQTQPLNYWTCDTVNDNGTIRDMKGNFNLQLPNQTYTIATGGAVSKYLSLDKNARVINGSGSASALTGSFSIEMIWRPGRNLGSTQFWSLGNKASCKLSITQSSNGNPTFQFNVDTNKLYIELNQSGKQQIGYYLNKWTHLVWTYNNATGVMKLYVDGECPTTFTKTIPASSMPAGNAQLTFNSVTDFRKIYGHIDEIAVYTSAIAAGQVTSNKNDFEGGVHYRFLTTAPLASSTTAGIYTLIEYAPGSLLTDSGHTNGVSVSAITQLASFPYPRYKSGNKLNKLFNFMDLRYMAGLSQSGVNDSIMAATALPLNINLATKWNYYFTLTHHLGTRINNYKDTTKAEGKWMKWANANPEIPTAAFVFQAQINPSQAGFTSSTGYVENQTLPARHYLQNAAGQYLSKTGTISVTKKWLAPDCPLDSLKLDGVTARWYLDTMYKSLTRPLNYLVENDEVLPLYSTSVLQLDPSVVSDQIASGLNWTQYNGSFKGRLTRLYRDSLLKDRPWINFNVYQVGGYDPIWPAYVQLQSINTPINGYRYPSVDLYPRWPDNWEIVTSSWRGHQAAVESKAVEIAAGDKLASYWISPGWHYNETVNIRPAQWLGLLKCWSAMGSEYFHVGLFNLAWDTCENFTSPCRPPAYSKNYIWQAAMPAYAQAVTSYYEDVLKLGDLMAGDRPTSIDPPKTGPGYRFITGDPRVLCVARKYGSKYVIASSLNVYSNKQFDLPGGVTTTIYIDGDTLTFETRRQGSVYIYDKTNPAAKLFYQLDTWHESSHPSYWSTSIKTEAEVCDTIILKSKILTEQNEGAAPGDYRFSTSYLQLQPRAKVNYSLSITESKVYYLWFRARKASGYGTLQAKIGARNLLSDRITSRTWKWERIYLGPLTGNTTSTLQLISKRGDFDLDSFEITPNQFEH